MCKCVTCGRVIKNVYILDGKNYGYNCYKMALSLKYAKMQEIKNNSYICKCVALIDVFQNKEFTSKWNISFKESILKQWNACKKLTGKQMDVIIDKLDNIEYAEFMLYYYMLNKKFVESGITPEKNHIYNLFNKDNDVLKLYKNDERLHSLIKEIHNRVIERHCIKFYIVESKDVDDDFSICEIVRENRLEQDRQDEYIEIIEVIAI